MITNQHLRLSSENYCQKIESNSNAESKVDVYERCTEEGDYPNALKYNEIQATLLNPDWCGPWTSVRIRQNPNYAYRNYMYRKGLGPSNLTGLDENPDYTCPD